MGTPQSPLPAATPATRGRGLLVPALIVALAGAAPAAVGAQERAAETAARITQLASVTTGSIYGIVLDDRGTPLDGVVVSALGSSTSFAVTDATGQYTLRSLIPGPYLVRAHLPGYVPARHTMVDVRPSARTSSSFTLRRSAGPDTPRVAAAGIGVTGVTVGEAEERDESETAWRLRHLKRSVLKDRTHLPVPAEDDDWFLTDSFEFLGRAVESSTRVATALFADLPIEGQVNFLTTSAFSSPAEALRFDRAASVAFFELGAPVGTHGDWTVRAALNQSDLSSWMLAGGYATRPGARHSYRFGMSYSLQRYDEGSALALAAVPEAARNVGSVYGYDEWTVSRRVTLGYGATFAHYDYLDGPSLFSPRLSATLAPTERTRIRAVAARHLSAPGAQEFLPPPSRMQWLPPQRTFSALAPGAFRTEGVAHFELGLEQVLDGATIGVRAFRQDVDDQGLTAFGLRPVDRAVAELGHYFVGTAGDVALRGWAVTVSRAVGERVRGSVEYSLVRATWTAAPPRGDLALIRAWLPSALRAGEERIHDVTTTVETAIPESATRVFVLYKVNNGFASADRTDRSPGFDGRFDVQVNQGLPFMNFLRAEWEALVVVRTLFHQHLLESSFYDELLVVRPPKRLIGGLTVKF